MLINDWKIINKLNRNADSYYVNSELVDCETPNLLNSAQSVQKIPYQIQMIHQHWVQTKLPSHMGAH